MATKNVREGLSMLGLDQLGVGPLNLGNVFGGVDLMRKVWSAVSMPGNLAPTLNVEELDKRIGDLRAVEQWLAMNLNMLRGTIQALEVQRGTVATLRAFGSAVAPTGREPSDEAITIDPEKLMAAIAQMQASVAAQRTPGAGEAASTRPADAMPVDGGNDPAGTSRTRGAKKATAAAPIDATAMANAWWSLLQSQFNQVANAAISGVGLGAAAVREGARQMAARAAQGEDDTRRGRGKKPGSRPGAGRAREARSESGKPGSTRGGKRQA